MAVACLLAAADLRAQEVAPVCADGRIAEVRVQSHGIFDRDEVAAAGRWAWAYRSANALHTPTRVSVVEREILMREGDCFDPLLVGDSERLLRASNFIAVADIEPQRQPNGDWILEVEVWDEWALHLIPLTESREGLRLSGATARQDNLLGTGQEIELFYRELFGDPWYGVFYANPQILGSRLQGTARVESTPTGVHISETLTWPFVGDRGRWAVRQQFVTEDRYFDYVAMNGGGAYHVLFPEERRSFDLGALYRFRQRDRTALLGAAVAGEWIQYPGDARLYRREGDPPADGIELGELTARMDSVASLRFLLMAGHRDVAFLPRMGLDAVRAMEDVKVGSEVEVVVGRSLRDFSTDDDISIDLGIFAAGEHFGRVISGMGVVAEAKRKYNVPFAESSEWRDIFAEGSVWAYYRPSPQSAHTFLFAMQGAAGWETTVPFQLTLGRPSGLRGVPRVGIPAGQRLAGTLEHRAYLGWPAAHLFDLGAVSFLDAARAWAGDVPYGNEVPVNRLSVGGGLRAAFPSGSRRVFRLDVSIPVVRGGLGSGVELRVGIGQSTEMLAREPDYEIRRSSRRPVSPSLFTYPN